MRYIRWFSGLGVADVPLVGGKKAARRRQEGGNNVDLNMGVVADEGAVAR